MRTIKRLMLLFIASFVLFTVSCKKDKKSGSTVPQLTTTTVTIPTATTAVSGGTIVSNGGETISASGVCWSTNANPTIFDDTTKSTTASGSFTATLKNLASSTTYYVRAYATNRVGTGYGDVKQFQTGNAAPSATAVSITGTPKGDAVLTGNYTYNDAEADLESGTTFQWYMANDGTGAGEIPIVGATERTFRIQGAQEGKYIRFGVTPKAATGNQNGVEVKSGFTTAVGEGTTVTFIYNGAEVTYGIILGPSGKKWLDRNLGASRVAEAVTDYQAYGDLFQWGRLADGHQRVTRIDGTDAGASGTTGTSTNLSAIDTPTTTSFIIPSNVPYDWRASPNNTLWQGVNGINNPCPDGWHIATQAEWTAEGITNIDDGFSKLKLTYTGYRNVTDATFQVTATRGYYWSSTVSTTDPTLSVQIRFKPDTYSTLDNNRGNGYACRCIKD